MRVRSLSTLSVVVLLSVLVLMSGPSAHASTSNATITTDQSDYIAGSTVWIYGSGFNPSTTVTVSVTDPNNATTTWTVTSDSSGGFATTYVLDHVDGSYAVSASDGVNSAQPITFYDAAEAANDDQCTNGGVGAAPEPCDNGVVGSTSYANWVHGNSNGGKSHWQEGDFIGYRVDITGLTAGTHTFQFGWDTVHGSKHALDYIGSVNATESFATGMTAFHFNNNDPCQDLISCTPSSPDGQIAIPAASLVACSGSSGTFTGTQIPGKIYAYGTGTVLTGFSYLTQNVVSGTGQCSSTAQLTFTTVSGTPEVVIAWGGHIASQLNWGVGNSASAISGSPYHTFLISLDGGTVGSQDLALATSAIFFTPTISTVVINDATGLAVVSPIALGSTVHDTATLSSASATPTGTVTYKFYTNGVCSGTPSTTQAVTLSGGLIPNSASTAPLAAGSYSYNATYTTTDGIDFPKLPNNACEPFTVAQATTTISTVVVFKNGTPITSPITLGSIVNDTATISGQVGSVPATGSVTYRFFTSNTCTGTFASETVTVTSGIVPHSSQHGPLTAGLYSFNATYSGDSNYIGSTSACEPFQVGKTPSTTATAIHIAPSGTADVTGTTQPLGTSIFDTATVTGSTFTPTGTVTYSFFTNGACSGSAFSTQTVTMSGGAVPNSAATGALMAGSYSFQATYSGDSNYNSSPSSCETITIAKGTTSTSTVVFDAATNAAWSGTETTGASAYDTATVTTSDGFTATGTVAYTFYTNSACSGSGTGAGTVTLTGTGSVPNSNTEGPLAAGSYAFRAVYSGDSNYGGSTSSCEPFSGAKGSSNTATVVFDASTNSPWTGTETTGASAYDTSTVSTSDGFTATGTVSYKFYTNGGCSGTGASAGVATLTATGAVPNSNTQGPPLAAGSYSFQATYSGDSNYGGSTSTCEPFNVAKGSSTTATVVYDASTNAPWSASETTGASAYDTSTVTTTDSIVATGTVTYTFYANGACSGSGSTAGTVSLTATGSVPNSATEGPLTAGSYAFTAAYSGDSNYSGSTSPCEPFSVARGTSNISTTVIDASTNAPWTGTETTGASAYDTASVTTLDGFTATGSVTYTFFTNGGCTGTGASAGTVTLTATGSVPNSNTEGPPLAAGSYSFQASYSGDSNYSGSTSTCEPFSIAKGSSTVSTIVFDASTNAPWSGTETTGASAYDTSSVTTSDTIVATGTVTYTFYTSGDCSGTGVSQTVTLSGSGGVPNSALHGPLTAGSYSFKATYSGDTNYDGSTSSCEPFTVAKGRSNISTTVFDASTSAPWSGTETTGSSAYDTASVTTSDGFTATGTVAYAFYNNAGCTGTGFSAGSVTLTATGSVPNSNTEGPLTAGSYAFQATYSGDSNYSGSTSSCEPLSVARGSSNTATVVVDASTNAAWSGTETTGASAYDTDTVTTSDGFTATGTVTYTFFTNGACSGSGNGAGTVTLTATGSVPNSSPEGPLTAGTYSFQATYSGDSNYAGSTSPCEPFSVAKGTSSTATVVFDGSTNAAWSGTETTGSSAYDTATVTTSDGFVATGTVSYTFWTNGSCSSSGSPAGTVTLTATGSVPNSNTEGPPLAAGSYSFQATYSGDSNYSGSTSSCESFILAKGTSNTSTTVFDASTNAPWTGTETTGASAYDTAMVTTSDTIVATGTVTYTFYTTIDCSGSGATQTVTLSGSGAVPNSSVYGPLTAGSYSFKATYSGDSNYSGSTSSCEPFTVNKGSSATATVVYDVSTNAPWTGTETTGASAYDTASVTTSDGFTATGTVTYTFYSGGCSGPVISTQTVTLVGGMVPNSAPTGPLTAGSYAFQAVYSGDSNYSGSTSSCEPFTVNQGSSTTSTVVFDASTNSPWSGTETTGASAYDTSTVTTSDGFTATGTVTYTFFTNGSCGASGTGAGMVTLTGSGSVPNSNTIGPLTAGSYSFQAVYSGDNNYSGSTSPCEPFSVARGTSSTSTVVYDASTTLPWSGSETTGASAYDTASVTTSDGFVATGTVSYTFWTNGSCSGSGSSAGTVTLTATGTVPNSASEGPLTAGSYSFHAIYSGDTSYSGSTSSCEPFTVAKGTSNTATVVYDASTHAPWRGTETTGSSAYDTAIVTTSDGFTATGTVTYTFFTNGACSGLGTGSGSVTLTASGAVPNSNTQGPLMAGSYAFQAVYGGDSNYGGSTSPCEPFSVAKGSSSISTTVFDASTNAPWSGTETTGAAAYDTATVSASPFTPTGTVTYTFFTNADCSGAGAPAGTVTLTASGSVPQSNTQGPPLAAGSYSFIASYSGDSNYSGSTSSCEPFSVAMGSSTTATVVFDASTNVPWSGTQTTGASAYDTSTVNISDTIVATGTVSYMFYTNNACSGSGSFAGTVTLTATGTVPNSATEGPLTAGSYSFQATYSGDANYGGSTSSCEPFGVARGSSSTATVVYDASANAPWAGTETTGASAYDTASITTSDTIVATGTVTYTFWTNSACSGSDTTQIVTLTGSGSVPNSATHGPLTAGSYSFQATYNGDSNYSSSISPCEPFSLAKGSSNTSTTIFDASTNAPWSGTETTGAAAYDTATISASPFTPTGTVTYSYFTNGSCSGIGASAGTVTLTASGSVPNSNTEGPPLAAGSYSFTASFAGDSNYNGSTSSCEPFSVAKGSSTISTTVFDASTNSPWSGTETTGASAYDTSTVSISDSITATGTVQYDFFSNAGCTGSPVPQIVTLTGTGSVPNSAVQGPLKAGGYSFQAVYSGDVNYNGSTSSCEPFSVHPTNSATSTTVTDQTTGMTVPPGTTSLGDTVHDSATVVGVPSTPFPITGTIQYQLSTNGCTGPFANFGLAVSVGTNSGPLGPLTPGSYAFRAVYSGDSNYNSSTSPCEPFTVAKNNTTTSTTVFTSTGTSVPLNGTIQAGTSVYDTSTVTASPFTPTGTVTYTFYTNGGCTGSGTTQTVTLSVSGAVPNSATQGPLNAGSYSFHAVYSGDSNYNGSTSACEPFIVPKNSPTIATQVSPSTTTVGNSTAVHDTATLSGGYNPTGSITFKVYFNSPTCSAGSLVFTSSAVPVTANGSYISTPGFTPTMAGTYYWVASYSGDSNNNPFTSACGANGETLLVNMSQVTDTSFCPIPQNQFPLNLITDPTNPSAFEMVSTNPGQFYDNVFYVGPPGSSVTLTIGIPFPFVTQGAVPIQVSSSFAMVGNCFQPSFDATSKFGISATGGTLSSSGAPIIILSDYTTQQLGSYVTITVSGTVPSTGLVYVTVHMNYGLRQQDFNKITTGTSSGTPPISCSTNPCAQWTSNTAVILGSPQPYPFTVGGSLTTSYSVTSVNNFKKDPGFAGVVTDANGKAIAGATVKIYDSNGNLLGITTTDSNGVYLFAYKYNGPQTTFTVAVTSPTGVTQTQSVVMKSNKLVLADFGF